MKLSGGETYRTRDGSRCLRVTEGEVLVYIIPYENQVPLRKLFLCEVAAGGIIPYLDCEAEGKKWSFQLMALHEARGEERELPQDQDEREMIWAVFAKKAGVFLLEPDQFPLEMVEKYNLDMVKNEAYVYASARERVRSDAKCRELAAESIEGKKREKPYEVNKNLAYSAVYFLCERRGIEILPFERLKEIYPRKMDVFDIAAASRIPVREIYLEPGWMKQDIGAFLAYRREDQSPLVFFRKRGRYWLYDPETGENREAIPEDGTKIADYGVMYYRAFGAEKMSLSGLCLFGMKENKTADILGAVLLAVVGALFALLLPTAYEFLYGTLLPAGRYTPIWQFGAMLAACMAGYFCLSFVKYIGVFGITNRMEHAVMSAIYDRLMHLPETVIRQFDSADLAQRAIRMTEVFRKAAREITGAAVVLLFAVVFFIRMLCYDVGISLLVLLPLGLFLAAAGFLGSRLIRAEKEKQEEEGEMSSLMFQYLSGIQKVRIDGMEDRALYEYLKKYTKVCELEQRESRNRTWIDLFWRLASGLCTMAVFGGFLTMKPDMGIGAFTGFLAVTQLFAQSILDVCMSLLRVDYVLPTYHRCRPILEHRDEAGSGEGNIGKLEGGVEVSHVTFSYHENEGRVLDDISFKINPGEYVGIVGASGCGKSTLFQLLLGFQVPDKGCIFYDHKDLEHVSKPELRKKLGAVLQDESLFTGSIYENIAVSRIRMEPDEVWKLLDQVGMKEEVEQMPMGLHTIVTESGTTISGGQRQRILLARALAGKPSVLLLDEATSALDNQTQDKVIQTVGKGRMTRIVIAHRISTVKKCSRILVMDKGRIAEEGTYKELLGKKGIFYELARRQLTKDETAAAL